MSYNKLNLKSNHSSETESESKLNVALQAKCCVASKLVKLKEKCCIASKMLHCGQNVALQANWLN